MNIGNVKVYNFSGYQRDLGSGHYLWSGWGLKRKYYVASNKFYPTICLSQIFFTPPKENSKTRLHLCLNIVCVFTLPLCSKIILLPHLTLLIFSVTPPCSLQSPPWSHVMAAPLSAFLGLKIRVLNFHNFFEISGTTS